MQKYIINPKTNERYDLTNKEEIYDLILRLEVGEKRIRRDLEINSQTLPHNEHVEIRKAWSPVLRNMYSRIAVLKDFLFYPDRYHSMSREDRALFIKSVEVAQ